MVGDIGSTVADTPTFYREWDSNLSTTLSHGTKGHVYFCSAMGR